METRTVPTSDDAALEVLQSAVHVLAAKWSLTVLNHLSSGTYRFNELLRQIDGVSRRMLSATLRQLEREGLVERHVYARVPARVEYELSDTGEALLQALTPLVGWGLEHRDAVLLARERFQDWSARGQALQAKSQADSPRII
jgi:DNA-binding HxlR family transcriptional regulator